MAILRFSEDTERTAQAEKEEKKKERNRGHEVHRTDGASINNHLAAKVKPVQLNVPN